MGFATPHGEVPMDLGMEVGMVEVVGTVEACLAGGEATAEAGAGEPMVRAGQDLIGARPTEAPTQ